MKLQYQQEQEQFNQFLKNQPAFDFTNKNYSLEPDLVTGWVPKLKIIGPVPLNFDNQVTDQVVQTLAEYSKTSFFKLVYLGSRPHNTFKLHQLLSSSYPFKYEHLYKNNYLHLQPFYKKFYSHFQTKTKRIFSGMNPLLQKNQIEVIFDSQFQCGNLDAAIRISQGEYDLFLRVDSNTKGHLQWYYFKLKNISLRKIKLNIVNFKKDKTLYQRGMKPFIKINGNWGQAAKNITFKDNQLRYKFLEQVFKTYNYTYKQLSFQYQFQNFNQEIEIAYCIPYTYSRVMKLISSLENQIKGQDKILVSKVLCQSLSGLQIPILTITNPKSSVINKRCIFVIARQHPGQSNGSFVMEGFLRWIVSDSREAIQLRNMSVIKVVPMLNPDGVIMGNYRTSFCGKDLNRLFKHKNCFLFPEVQGLKLEVSNTKKEFKNKFTLFMDLHGHSIRRNVFMYGPGFSLSQDNYYKIRIFPKIISDQSQMFRYHSCSFKITPQKQSTARAVFSRFVSCCYTVETSNWSYYWRQKKIQIQFNSEKWQLMGQKLAYSSYRYIVHLKDQQKKLKIMKKKEKDKYVDKQKQKQLPQLKKPLKNIQIFKSINKKNKNSERQHGIQSQRFDTQTQKNFMDNNVIDQIKKLEDDLLYKSQDSDEFDSSGNDSQSDSQDIKQQQLLKFHKLISKMILQFQSDYFKKNQLMSIGNDLVARKNRKIARQQRKLKVITSNIESEMISCNKKKKNLNKSPPINKLKSFQILQIIPKIQSIKVLKNGRPQKMIPSKLDIRVHSKNKQSQELNKNNTKYSQNHQKTVFVGQTQELTRNLRISTQQSNKNIYNEINNKFTILSRIFPKTIERKIDQVAVNRQKLQNYLRNNIFDETVNKMVEPVKQTLSNIRIRNISSKVNSHKGVHQIL